jgi:hypothetical protein
MVIFTQKNKDCKVVYFNMHTPIKRMASIMEGGFKTMFNVHANTHVD